MTKPGITEAAAGVEAAPCRPPGRGRQNALANPARRPHHWTEKGIAGGMSFSKSDPVIEVHSSPSIYANLNHEHPVGAGPGSTA